jgi:hypothetical protein
VAVSLRVSKINGYQDSITFRQVWSYLDTNQTTLAAWPFSSPGPVLIAVGNTDGIEGHRKIIVKGERLKSDFA